MSGIIASNIDSNSGLIKAPSAGVWVKISAVSASSSSDISFTSGLDSTYDKYCFIFNNIHAATNDATFKFNGSSDSGSNYNVTKTTTYFDAFHIENDSQAAMGYRVAEDVAQGTGVATILRNLGNDNDQSASGYLYLFNPASTTFVKHFIGGGSTYGSADENINNFTAGYFNTTSAVDAIQFKMSSGNIDAGIITLYGIN
tara:strand:- start:433 stop:1032 length:600 start_codon:yes stop_codon:yes gene_type:complete